MNKSAIVILVIIILAIVGLVFALTGNKEPADIPEVPTETATTTDMTATTTPEITATSTPATSTPAVSAKTHYITYTESGFSPTSITIKKGDMVTFRNNSARAFWPASDEHPTHTAYPEFDPKKTVAAGDSWSFTFTKTGAWEYHDHRAATLGGMITVQ